ncbi:MAG: 50S ribosomal protein L25 [Patescibacteria group bacterium]
MTYAITAAERTTLGRRAKHTHDSGNVPAVVYGHGIKPQAIQVPRSEFRKLYRSAGTSSLVDLTIGASTPVKALIQEVQVHPVTMDPYHVDFRQIRMDEELTVEVPFKFIGESKAVKELAGTAMFALNHIEVKCLPADLPHEIEVDLSVLNTFEDRITVGSLKLPKGVTALGDESAVIAAVERPLTEDELKKLEEESAPADVTAIKTEAEEKKAAEDAKKAEEGAAAEAAK